MLEDAQIFFQLQEFYFKGCILRSNFKLRFVLKVTKIFRNISADEEVLCNSIPDALIYKPFRFLIVTECMFSHNAQNCPIISYRELLVFFHPLFQRKKGNLITFHSGVFAEAPSILELLKLLRWSLNGILDRLWQPHQKSDRSKCIASLWWGGRCNP